MLQSTQLLSGHKVVSLPPTQMVKAENGKKLTIIVGTSLSRLTSSDGSLQVFQKDGVLVVEPTARKAAPSSLRLSLPTLDKLDVAHFDSVTVKLQRPQTIALEFNDIGKVSVVGPRSTISELAVNNVTQFKLHGRLDLQKLILKGNGYFTAQHVRSQQLTIEKAGASMAVLRGAMPITHIEQRGSGEIDLYWMKSKQSTIDLRDTGKIKLAGLTDHLIATVENDATLDAKFLRVTTIHATTYDRATALVYPLTSLYAQTFGPSTIKYFHPPVYMYENNAGDGVILPAER